MRIDRRQLLLTGAFAGLSGLLPASLRLAKAAEGVMELTAGPGKHVLYRKDSPPSDLWLYNGTSPGPEIRIKRGVPTRIRLVNRLDEPTSVHWHGIRIANAMDGVSGLTQEAVPKGGTFDYEVLAPDAGTFWYHAHNKSWNQVGRGLYGPLIVEEDEPAFDAAHDLTLVIDDWRLNRDGTLNDDGFRSMMDWSHAGRLGNWITVNGLTNPVYPLKAGEAYRLRLVNAANSRIFELDPKPLDSTILAYDGQPLPEPAALGGDPLLLGPAQRIDLLCVPKAEGTISLREISADPPFEFARFEVSGGSGSLAQAPRLVPNALSEPRLEGAKAVRLNMTGGAMGGASEIVYRGRRLEGRDFFETGQVWAFNGVANMADEPLFRVRKGETVRLETVNNTAFAHAMHVHGHHFRILERSGSTIDERRPWRDTFLIGSEQTTTVAFVADNPGKWLLHCHMLEHAAAGMTTWFEVT